METTRNKLYYSISDTADELGVPKYVIRFWESKFPQISPMRRAGGRRYFRQEDIRCLQLIKNLLYQKGLTIKGAQSLLRTRDLRMLYQETHGSDNSDLRLTPEIMADVEVRDSASANRDTLIQAFINELQEIRKLVE